MRTKSPQLPEWDEIVLFTATSVRKARPVRCSIGRRTPGFNGSTRWVASVWGQRWRGTRPSPTSASSTRATARPSGPTRPRGPRCLRGRAPAAVEDPSPQPAPALCAPALYSYFDSLAQATANLYGPYLGADSAPRRLGVHHAGHQATGEFTAGIVEPAIGGPGTKVWNALVNTRGSLLGGNTFADNGNRTWSVVRPPPNQGVSAPFEGAHMLRFQPIDLYVMGFLPSSAVPPSSPSCTPPRPTSPSRPLSRPPGPPASVRTWEPGWAA